MVYVSVKRGETTDGKFQTLLHSMLPWLCVLNDNDSDLEISLDIIAIIFNVLHGLVIILPFWISKKINPILNLCLTLSYEV